MHTATPPNLLSEASLEQLARLLGENSAAAFALAEGRRRAAAGESVEYQCNESSIIVWSREPVPDANSTH